MVMELGMICVDIHLICCCGKCMMCDKGEGDDRVINFDLN
jgi:hypothetical protein